LLKTWISLCQSCAAGLGMPKSESICKEQT
jgi:hypothetical protein